MHTHPILNGFKDLVRLRPRESQGVAQFIVVDLSKDDISDFFIASATGNVPGDVETGLAICEDLQVYIGNLDVKGKVGHVDDLGGA